MSLYTLTIIQKLLSSVFFFLSGLLWKKILKNQVNYHLIYYRTLFSILFLFIVTLILSYFDNDFSYGPLSKADMMDWVITLSICFFSFFGLYYFTQALQKGRFTIVVPMSSLTGFFAVLSAFLFFKQTLSSTQILAFIVIFVGLVYHQYNDLINLRISRELLLILMFTFFWGVSFSLYLIPIETFGPINFTLILEVCVLVSTLFLLFFKERRIFPKPTDKITFYGCIAIGFCVAGGSMLSNIALAKVSVLVNVLIGLLFEGLVLIIGIKFFKDKIFFKDWILIIAITIGCILIMF
ncbi:EamA family transporter [Crocinitomicaceae bacterium]|nr:EamA family transporter [Crocinitomicaceae bacterium]